mmetsp:Transcript_15299/g.63554  ORF Transcript_15299/g.63554 Transcript_15299/m.63554 type:complete len:228 (+) Transcript_15299:1345-2028(+)
MRVEVVKPEQHLSRDLADGCHGNAAVAEALDQRQQVVSEHFEDHAHVRAVWAAVLEVIEQGERAQLSSAEVGTRATMRLLFAFCSGLAGAVAGFATLDLLEDPYFVVGSFGVVLCTLLHLERHLPLPITVPAEPHRRKVAPSELAMHNVAAAAEALADAHRMIAARTVALVALILAVAAVVALLRSSGAAVGEHVLLRLLGDGWNPLLLCGSSRRPFFLAPRFFAWR